MTFFAGPPFAPFSGLSSVAIAPGESVVPFINGKSCGYGKSGQGDVDPEHMFSVFVFSNEQQAGCGTEGAQVIFKLVDGQGNVVAVASQTARWYAWTGNYNEWQDLDLTFGSAGGIRVGNVGGGPDSAASPWLGLSLGLALVGLASGIGGFVLRRRLRPPPIDPV